MTVKVIHKNVDRIGTTGDDYFVTVIVENVNDATIKLQIEQQVTALDGDAAISQAQYRVDQIVSKLAEIQQF